MHLVSYDEASDNHFTEEMENGCAEPEEKDEKEKELRPSSLNIKKTLATTSMGQNKEVEKEEEEFVGPRIGTTLLGLNHEATDVY